MLRKTKYAFLLPNLYSCFTAFFSFLESLLGRHFCALNLSQALSKVLGEAFEFGSID